MTKHYLNELTYKVMGAAIEVHKNLGPGLLESVYQKCMRHELQLRKIDFVSQHLIQTNYKGLDVNFEMRSDFLIQDILVVELKSVEGIIPIHEAQLLSYMKLMEKPKGILINFNCQNLFKEGQRTFVNEYFRMLPEI